MHTPLKSYERRTWKCCNRRQIILCLRHTIHSCSFLSLHPLRSLSRRGNSSCMQVISVCSDGRSALIGWLNSYADVKIAGCVCQKATLLVVVTTWRQMSVTGHTHSAKPEIYNIFLLILKKQHNQKRIRYKAQAAFEHTLTSTCSSDHLTDIEVMT